MAVKAFEHTAAYDGMDCQLASARLPVDKETAPSDDATATTQFSRTFNHQFTKAQELRYGETHISQQPFM